MEQVQNLNTMKLAGCSHLQYAFIWLRQEMHFRIGSCPNIWVNCLTLLDTWASQSTKEVISPSCEPCTLSALFARSDNNKMNAMRTFPVTLNLLTIIVFLFFDCPLLLLWLPQPSLVLTSPTHPMTDIKIDTLNVLGICYLGCLL